MTGVRVEVEMDDARLRAALTRLIDTLDGDVPCSVEKGEAGMVGLRGQAASLMVSMALFAFAFFT